MIHSKTFFILILIAFFTIACSRYSLYKDIEHALRLAGDNRGELEQVLGHYSNNPADSLKLRAAKFLIVNMHEHYSFKDTTSVCAFYDKIDSVANIYKWEDDDFKDSLFNDVIKQHRVIQYKANQEDISDILIMKAAYLIENIDRSFDVWENGNWSSHVNFDDFCEYILPYKVCEKQILDNWKEYFKTYCDGYIDRLQHCQVYKNTAYYSCEMVNNTLRDSVRARLNYGSGVSIRRMSTLTKIPTGSCYDYSTLATAVMRAKGIPVVMDFTPQWPFRSMGHSWNVLLETSGKKVVFEGCERAPALPHKEEYRMAKVFRQTYAINSEIANIHETEKHVPATFKNVCVKDVTTEYLATIDLKVRVEDKTDKKYAYLSVFDNANWIPVHFGKISGRNTSFNEIGKRIVYLPVLYGEEGIEPFSDPIQVEASGKYSILRADTVNKQQLLLKRKYPLMESLDECSRIIGGRIQIANKPTFSDSLTLYTITKFGLNPEEIDLSNIADSARYWRYYPPDFAYCNVAELFFYEKDSIQPIMGKIIGTEGTYRTDARYGKEAVFDGDVLTFFDAPETSGCWVGLDFGRPVKIDRIIYYSRSDGNSIEIGDEYELLYWADNTWQSMGKKIATDITLSYSECPTNALFLLRNHTKGKEERIFTYENEQQVWW